jgi:hypothetical protein
MESRLAGRSEGENYALFMPTLHTGRISGKNLVTFDSKEEAERAGYVPCKVCKPRRK